MPAGTEWGEARKTGPEGRRAEHRKQKKVGRAKRAPIRIFGWEKAGELNGVEVLTKVWSWVGNGEPEVLQ